MSSNTFKTLDPIKYASNESDEASNDQTQLAIPKIPWFYESGISADYPSTFSSNYGTIGVFRASVEGTSYNYIDAPSNPFWPQEGSDSGMGFSVQKNAIEGIVEFNYKIAGGSGYWMPCPMFRSFGFHWENQTSLNSNFAPRRVALICKNWKTDEEKIWSPGWDTKSYNENTGRLYYFSQYAKATQVRALGADWYVYGVIFNFLSNYSPENTAPRGTLSDFRLGYNYLDVNATSQNTHRWILTKKQSWSSLKSMLSSGVYEFESYT